MMVIGRALLDDGELADFILPSRNGVSALSDTPDNVQIFAGEQAQLIETVSVGDVAHLFVVLLIRHAHLSNIPIVNWILKPYPYPKFLLSESIHLK